MLDKHINYREEDIESAITVVARVIDLYGDAYWPIFERLEEELATRNGKRNRLKKYLKSCKKK